MEADSNTLGHKEYYNDPGAVAHTVAQDFNSYCAASAVISINFWTPYLNDKDDIVNLVFDMMNPSKPHFERLCDSLEIMQNSLLVFAENGVDTDGQFWVLDWIVPPANIKQYKKSRVTVFKSNEQSQHRGPFRGRGCRRRRASLLH
jgi:hypothetical protein